MGPTLRLCLAASIAIFRSPGMVTQIPVSCIDILYTNRERWGMTAHLRSRRSFVQELALGAVIAPWVTSGARTVSPNGKIRHATFGCMGQAAVDIDAFAKHPALEVVAGCDVDEKRTAGFRKKFPRAKVYTDFRELLEKETDLDSVNISTPDHMHAPIGLAALKRNLHVYGQKPLAHDIAEVRAMTALALEKKRITQMGIHKHTTSEYRTAVRLIQGGIIGKVREVHAWSSKKWGDNGAMPDRAAPVPQGLHWDLWLGVCGERPFIGNQWYHPLNWRKRLDFGTGTFGDMGCHIYDSVFAALALTAPLSVRSEGPAPNAHSWATDAVIHYEFPGTAYTEGKTVKVVWYDGDQRPPARVQALARPAGTKEGDKSAVIPDQGSLFLGTDGVMVLPHFAPPHLFGAAAGRPVEKAEGTNHFHEYLDAILGTRPNTSTPFTYSGPLTEAVLLGGIATRFPKTVLQWDAVKLAFTNTPEANAFVRRPYRSGW